MFTPNPFRRTTLYLVAGRITVAALIALVWAPLDADTGLIETVRRRVSIGDGLMQRRSDAGEGLTPTIATAFIGLAGVLVVFPKHDPLPSGVTFANLRFLAALLGVFAIGFALMRWTGPLAVAVVNLFNDEDMTYRALRDTGPRKNIRFLTGGACLVTAMIPAIEGRLTRRACLIGGLAICALIALYDLPFDDCAPPPERRRVMTARDAIWMDVPWVFHGPKMVSVLAVSVPVALVMIRCGFVIGVMKGATIGGAAPAILFNTVGTPDACMATPDGHPMARAGPGEKGAEDRAFQLRLRGHVIGHRFDPVRTVTGGSAPVDWPRRNGPVRDPH
jgi:hypothetical protein